MGNVVLLGIQIVLVVFCANASLATETPEGPSQMKAALDAFHEGSQQTTLNAIRDVNTQEFENQTRRFLEMAKDNAVISNLSNRNTPLDELGGRSLNQMAGLVAFRQVYSRMQDCINRLKSELDADQLQFMSAEAMRIMIGSKIGSCTNRSGFGLQELSAAAFDLTNLQPTGEEVIAKLQDLNQGALNHSIHSLAFGRAFLRAVTPMEFNHEAAQVEYYRTAHEIDPATAQAALIRESAEPHSVPEAHYYRSFEETLHNLRGTTLPYNSWEEFVAGSGSDLRPVQEFSTELIYGNPAHRPTPEDQVALLNHKRRLIFSVLGRSEQHPNGINPSMSTEEAKKAVEDAFELIANKIGAFQTIRDGQVNKRTAADQHEVLRKLLKEDPYSVGHQLVRNPGLVPHICDELKKLAIEEVASHKAGEPHSDVALPLHTSLARAGNRVFSGANEGMRALDFTVARTLGDRTLVTQYMEEEVREVKCRTLPGHTAEPPEQDRRNNRAFNPLFFDRVEDRRESIKEILIAAGCPPGMLENPLDVTTYTSRLQSFRSTLSRIDNHPVYAPLFSETALALKDMDAQGNTDYYKNYLLFVGSMNRVNNWAQIRNKLDNEFPNKESLIRFLTDPGTQAKLQEMQSAARSCFGENNRVIELDCNSSPNQ